MVKVAISGNFFPLHDGHIDHIEKASKLGDYLVAIVGSDEYLERKGKNNPLPLKARMRVVRAIKGIDGVIGVIDDDGTVAKTLRLLKPDIYAKGGDRTPDNMPPNELRVCRDIGCKIVYGVGDLIRSSSNLWKDF